MAIIAAVAAPVRERVGVLVIRAWNEGEPEPVRLRITSTLDLEREEELSSATTSIDEACEIVCSWLEEFVRRA